MLPAKQGSGSGQGGKDPFRSREIRETGGSGSTGVKPKAKKKRGVEDCSVCYGCCCGPARELVAHLWGVGAIKVSPKVIK